MEDYENKVLNLLNSDEDLPSFDLLYGETRAALLRALSNVRGLGTKAAAVAALDGVVIGGVLAILAEGNLFSRFRHFPVRWVLALMISGGVVLVLFSFMLAMWAYWVESWASLLDPEVVCARRLEQEEDRTKRRLLASWIDSYKDNVRAMKTKADFLRISIIMLGVAILVLGLTSIVYVFALSLS